MVIAIIVRYSVYQIAVLDVIIFLPQIRVSVTQLLLFIGNFKL